MLRQMLLFVLCLSTSVKASYTWNHKNLFLSAKVDDAIVRAQFIMSNTGNTPVTVLNVRPGCGCTTFSLSKNTLYPGQKLSLDFEVQLGSEVGQVAKNVVVEIADGSKPVQKDELTIHVDIPSPLVIDPRILVWERGSSPTEKVANVKINWAKAVHITSIESSHSIVKTSIAADPKQINNYFIKVDPSSTESRFFAMLIIHTDLPNDGTEKRFELDVMVE